MLGPVVDLELLDPSDKVPTDVEFSIRHFLTVPNSLEAQVALDNPEDQHHIVKLTKVNGKLELEIIDSIHSVTSEYFSTSKLSGRSLCWIAPVFSIDLCWHSSLKEIIFTKSTKKCSHEKFSLDVHCVCPSAKEAFEKRLAKHDREVPSDAVITQDIDKSHDIAYTISIQLRMDESESGKGEKREISHLEMCKYGGIRKLGGLVMQTLACGCEKGIPEHCGRSDAAVFLQIEEKRLDRVIKTDSSSFSLHCEHGRQQREEPLAQV